MTSLHLKRESSKILRKVLQRAYRSKVLADFIPPRMEIRHFDCSFVSSLEMKKIYAKYLGQSKDTDILSFAAPESLRPFFAGTLVVSIPRLKKQATQNRLKWQEELEILLVHGFLHLMGLDHERGVTERKAMAKLELELLSEKILKKCKGLISRAHR